METTKEMFPGKQNYKPATYTWQLTKRFTGCLTYYKLKRKNPNLATGFSLPMQIIRQMSQFISKI